MYYDNNISGTVTLLDVMKEYNCKSIVFSSSATVYGNNPIPYEETMVTGDVSNPYGRTKHFIEQILGDVYVSDNEWSISLLRYFNPIGAHESGLIGEDPNGIPNNLMPYISRVAIGKLPQLTVFGGDYDTKDGTCIRDYIHVVDLAKAHLCALNKLKSDPHSIDAYNIGTGIGYSVLDIINAFEDATGQKVNYKIGERRQVTFQHSMQILRKQMRFLAGTQSVICMICAKIHGDSKRIIQTAIRRTDFRCRNILIY